MAANPSWRIRRAIGCGATATVSLAADSNSGDLFAVKSSPLARASLLRREKSILSSLSSPHIISCLGSDISGDYYHLFLELAAGGAISDIAGRIDEPKIQSFARQILLGLSYLHSKGITHGDVKGRNVLLCSEGRVKLADFGCARRIGDGDGDRSVMGTPAFMAPEVARGEEQGIAGDVWSLGCTVVEMATGKSPWPEASDPVAAIRRILFSCDVPTMPEWVSDKGRDFVSKCLRRDPTERWTAEELLRHPFILDAEEFTAKWVSPKSTMEFDLWDSETEEDEDEDDDDDENDLASSEKNLRERIRQYESSPANWVWDDSWIEIRGRRAKSDETETPEFECSSGGDEASGLWSESMNVMLKELNSVFFTGEEIEQSETEYVSVVSRCNDVINDINEFQIYYSVL